MGRSDANPWLSGDSPRGPAYDRRFDELAAQGHDVHGEATLVAGLGAASVLDAGCGTGRVAVELAARGIDVVGVDLDPAMLAAARGKAPDLRWVQGDLATVDLARTFGAVLLAGNVVLFVSPGTEGAVLANMARHLEPGGLLVAGFSLRPGAVDLITYDRLLAAAGLVLAGRWAGWDRRAFRGPPGADYAVSVHRREAT